MRPAYEKKKDYSWLTIVWWLFSLVTIWLPKDDFWTIFATPAKDFEVGRITAGLLTAVSTVWLHLLPMLFLITSIKKTFRSDQ